ncbi:PREDICTED: uncharacterized protein LOC109115697 [Nelumbo nucifera]|uniref:Uncharacterized protein LOC109115697 n=1 Tax=Nelumbo nucifera TaxID=4432 RepID=A0A1U8QA91_NELNU|nr:PREDICTED: uncharacterized protein LOC109115697 [Nelumbo nucifera]
MDGGMKDRLMQLARASTKKGQAKGPSKRPVEKELPRAKVPIEAERRRAATPKWPAKAPQGQRAKRLAVRDCPTESASRDSRQLGPHLSDPATTYHWPHAGSSTPIGTLRRVTPQQPRHRASLGDGDAPDGGSTLLDPGVCLGGSGYPAGQTSRDVFLRHRPL